MSNCLHCNKEYSDNDMLEAANGELVCELCADTKCMRCLNGECEVETNSGDYICVDCYSGDIDNAYESMRD